MAPPVKKHKAELTNAIGISVHQRAPPPGRLGLPSLPHPAAAACPHKGTRPGAATNRCRLRCERCGGWWSVCGVSCCDK